MQLDLAKFAVLTFLLAFNLSSPRALAQAGDPEAEANQSLGDRGAGGAIKGAEPSAAASQPSAAAQPPASDPAMEPRATPSAKDLQPDDVLVEEIRTQGSSGSGKAKHAARPKAADDEENAGPVRDTENEARGNAPIGVHDDGSDSSGGVDPASGDDMTMKMHPAKSAGDDSAPTEKAVKPKPKRAQKVAVKPLKKVEKKASVKSAKAAGPSRKDEKASEESAAATSSVKPTAETVMKWLANGNTRFVKKNFRADGKSPADRERLEKGEHPHAAILAPSDSRVVPEIIFDQTLGEIYDVRAFGEGLDSATVAALEYAVAKLKVPLLVVLGNSDCAAVRTMSEDKVNENGDHVGDFNSPDVEKVIADMKPRLKTLKDDPVSPGFEVEATLNADGIARELVKRSDIIREAVEKNGLVIKSGLYRMNTGKVTFY